MTPHATASLYKHHLCAVQPCRGQVWILTPYLIKKTFTREKKVTEKSQPFFREPVMCKCNIVHWCLGPRRRQRPATTPACTNIIAIKICAHVVYLKFSFAKINLIRFNSEHDTSSRLFFHMSQAILGVMTKKNCLSHLKVW